MEKDIVRKTFDPERTWSEIQIIKAIQERQKALENSGKKGKLEFLLKPKFRQRLQIFSSAIQKDPNNCLFAEIYLPDDVDTLELQPSEEPLEIILKPGSDLTYESIAKQTAEFIRNFFEEYCDLPIYIYSSIDIHRLGHPITILEFSTSQGISR